MSDASQVVKSWLKAISKGSVETTTKYLAPNLDWLENGLTLKETLAKYPRPKWEGIQSKNFKYSSKVASDDGRNVVVEFTATFGGKKHHYCGVFKVSRGKITSAHWYADPARQREAAMACA